jgi:hypothetical protein
VACDPEELFKTKQAPDVGNIQTDAENFTVDPGDTVNFWIEASNPEEGELNYEWSVKDRDGNHIGVFIGSSKTKSVKWKAPISGGRYDVQVKVSNNDKSTTKTETLTVLSLVAPLVNILSPEPDDYLVQYQNITIQSEIIHPLGIYQAILVVNDTLNIEVISGNNSESYNFTWKVTLGAGSAELKIIAEANRTGAIGADSINVNIEGVVPGKINE